LTPLQNGSTIDEVYQGLAYLLISRKNNKGFMRSNLSPAQPSDEVNVGCRLRELRAERGISIRALAEQSGLNVNTLSLIENGKTSPSVSTFQQIAFPFAAPALPYR
jgi:DNA-binding XRE family transcriptional regulator